ncbi:MAG: 2-C-methyl-D-erythritol 4-phosphate cytidylyltransferase [Candidatus Omnitrophica bacterium]|nr:2-C-methyl-D-erythritol 4-phosphate cytidylyltransferase [Candidatus Omnitrophota bacterium]MBU2250754.1 2-C-methyl-D-erythritol 4-phosphate cytidylyltransferase [Candidatus Omnitrophota bacterium]MBU2265781.1 2-C-methyl-D-erythritol 4-phosphate cytidylyltransferase [Candidatus Omnitrophota bacterium]MBU2473693.1 2-C-methyl-D-erythritol 4-phosphate cytidylyltransferase [Candidatus Omnitrophota bacterium]
MISKVGLIMVCAGSGKRLGYLDKAFVKLDRKPLFLHAFAAFKKFKQIKQVIFVFRENSLKKARTLVKDQRAVFVKGGKHRKDSVFCGLKALDKSIEHVLIHDGARPLVSEKIIRGVLVGLEKYPAVISAIPAQDTVKSIRRGFVSKTLNREEIFLVQTPQGFKKDALLKAYDKYRDKKFTDDSQFIELLGLKVKVSVGSRFNLKITYPEDVILAEAITQSRVR